MKKIGYVLITVCALYLAPSHSDQLSINAGVNLQEYPELVAIPDYPVYYAPQLEANYFYYDGEFWLYQFDNWYRSSWYDGPWWQVDPVDVPEYILRIPVRFYRQPPIYFFTWWSEYPPHWGEHWGHDWERHRHDWDKWDHRVHPKLAPLPDYQREYSGDQYPRQIELQHELHARNYHYHSRDPMQQQRNRQQSEQRLQGNTTDVRIAPPKTEGAKLHGSTPTTSQHAHPVVQEHKQQPGTEAIQHQPLPQRSQDREPRQQGNEAAHESSRGQGREQERGRDR